MKSYERIFWATLTYILSAMMLSFIVWKEIFAFFLSPYLLVVLLYTGIPIIWMTTDVYAKISGSERIRSILLDKRILLGVSIAYLHSFLHLFIHLPVIPEYIATVNVLIHFAFWIMLFTRLKYGKSA